MANSPSAVRFSPHPRGGFTCTSCRRTFRTINHVVSHDCIAELKHVRLLRAPGATPPGRNSAEIVRLTDLQKNRSTPAIPADSAEFLQRNKNPQSLAAGSGKIASIPANYVAAADSKPRTESFYVPEWISSAKTRPIMLKPKAPPEAAAAVISAPANADLSISQNSLL